MHTGTVPIAGIDTRASCPMIIIDSSFISAVNGEFITLLIFSCVLWSASISVLRIAFTIMSKLTRCSHRMPTITG